MTAEAPRPAGEDSVEELIDVDAEPVAGTASVATATDEAKFYSASALAYRIEQSRLNLGALGKLFGASTSAPTNIAGLTILAALFRILLTYWAEPADAADTRKLLIGLISTSLAFIFGAASKK